jgi:hypothetical protein
MSSGRRVALATGRLARSGGLLITRLVDTPTLAALRAEAFASGDSAQLTDVAEPPADGEQRGQPERRMTTSVGGAVLAAFFTSRTTLSTLAALTGVAWEPLGNQGTYSFYGPGDHLGTHRDADNCDLAVITCIYDSGEPSEAGGDLVIYPGRVGETMAAIRDTPECGAHTIRVAPGQSAILLGGLVPHRVSPIGAGRLRIVAPLCYTTPVG